MKYIQISDFFEDEVNGGAELTDCKLREFIGNIEKRKCIHVTVEYLEQNKNNRFIISNFINLGDVEKKYLQNNCNYIIWEHDHKYLKTRDPSIFKDFLAPKEQIIYRDFYAKAKAVVCQTTLHAFVVNKNLQLDNILNFGGSIWSNEELDFIDKVREDCVKNKLVGWRLCYMNSDNPVKGTAQALQYCIEQKKKTGIDSYSIPPMKWEWFIESLIRNNSTFVFFPQVLETCSRVAVEARMLGLAVAGNKNISALQEDWFKAYKGAALTEYFRQKNILIPKYIDFCFSKREKTESVADITVVLNVYKRPQNLQKQIDAIKNQTIKPKEIWVWQNCSNDQGAPQMESEYRVLGLSGIDKWITSNHNWKFIGRFAMAQMAQTKFVAVFDDDTIPGPRWFENCLQTFQTNPGILGGIGIVLHSDDNYHDHHRHGWATHNDKVEEVDLVGHAWFMPKEYLKYMWYEEPFTWENGEDIHLSYCAQKYGNIKTFVPPHDNIDKSSSTLGYELGVDEVATSHPRNHSVFYEERNNCVKHATTNGWRRVNK